jgi:hypothetical protein
MPVRMIGVLLPALLVASMPGGVGSPSLPAPIAMEAGSESTDPCVDPGKVRSWSPLGDRRVLIDAGQQRFLVELAERCPQLSDNPFLGYRSDHEAGRVCGRSGDHLVPHGSSANRGEDCPVQRLRNLSSAEYEHYLKQSIDAVADARSRP